METDSVELVGKAAVDAINCFEASLIESVKLQRCLYVKTHPQFDSKLHNDFAWHRVSSDLKISAIACMNKWYTLLQNFLSLARLESDATALKWPHYKAFKEIQPLLIEKYVDLLKVSTNGYQIKVSSAQLEYMLKLLQQNSKTLMDVRTTNAERQEIWNRMANKLNLTKDCLPMAVIRWQKVWWNLKQKLRSKIERKGLNNNIMSSLSGKELIILKICSASQVDEVQFKEKMDSYIEFHNDAPSDSRGTKENNVCKECVILQKETNSKDLCANCSKENVILCDICSKDPFSNSCNVTSWSATAKELLPLALRNKSNLLMCQFCFTALKSKASLSWKVCRVCTKESDELENFLLSSFQDVREMFCSATQFTFSTADGLPCFVCPHCVEQMLEFNKFYKIFATNQALLRDTHKKQFIGEALEKVISHKSPKIVSKKRHCPKTPIKVEGNPIKRARLSKGIVTVAICENESPQASLAEVHGVPQNSNSKDSIEIKKELIQRSPSQLGASVQLTSCVPITPSNSPPSRNILIASRKGISANKKIIPKDSNSDSVRSNPVIDKVSNSDQQNVITQALAQTPISHQSKMKPLLSSVVIIKEHKNSAQPSVVASMAKSNAALNTSSGQIITASSNLNRMSNLSLPSSLQTDQRTSQIRLKRAPILAKAKEKESNSPPVNSAIQQTLNPIISIPSSSPLFRKVIMDPLLQGLLDPSQTEVTLSDVPSFDSPEMISSSLPASHTRPSSSPNGKSIKTSKKSVAPRKLPRRMSIHHLSSRKPRTRQASLDEDVIFIRNDASPREVAPLHNGSLIEVDMGTEVTSLDPLMLYPDLTIEEGVDFGTTSVAWNAASQEMNPNPGSSESLEVSKNNVQQSVEGEVNMQPSKKINKKPGTEKEGKNKTKKNASVKKNKQDTESHHTSLTSQDQLIGRKNVTDRKQEKNTNVKEKKQDTELHNTSLTSKDQSIGKKNVTDKKQKKNTNVMKNKQGTELHSTSLTSKDQSIGKKNITDKKQKKNTNVKKNKHDTELHNTSSTILDQLIERKNVTDRKQEKNVEKNSIIKEKKRVTELHNTSLTSKGQLIEGRNVTNHKRGKYLKRNNNVKENKQDTESHNTSSSSKYTDKKQIKSPKKNTSAKESKQNTESYNTPLTDQDQLIGRKNVTDEKQEKNSDGRKNKQSTESDNTFLSIQNQKENPTVVKGVVVNESNRQKKPMGRPRKGTRLPKRRSTRKHAPNH